jgi:hypothetical protein
VPRHAGSVESLANEGRVWFVGRVEDGHAPQRDARLHVREQAANDAARLLLGVWCAEHVHRRPGGRGVSRDRLRVECSAERGRHFACWRIGDRIVEPRQRRGNRDVSSERFQESQLRIVDTLGQVQHECAQLRDPVRVPPRGVHESCCDPQLLRHVRPAARQLQVRGVGSPNRACKSRHGRIVLREVAQLAEHRGQRLLKRAITRQRQQR